MMEMGAHELTRGIGHTLEHKSFPLNVRKHIFTLRVAQVVQGGCGVSILACIHKFSVCGAGWLALGIYPCLSREFGPDDL